MNMKFAMYNDLKYLYPEEVNVGEYALYLIRDELNIYLPKEETFSIALHFINAESVRQDESKENLNTIFIEDITKIIEREVRIKIDRDGFNYSRFTSHMEYLLKRSSDGKNISSENAIIYDSLKNSFPDTHKVAQKISLYFIEKLNNYLNEEELLYLMLHINRLCAREDCYQ